MANNNNNTRMLVTLAAVLAALCPLIGCQDANNNYEPPANYPYYMQSPIEPQPRQVQLVDASTEPGLTQRQTIPIPAPPVAPPAQVVAPNEIPQQTLVEPAMRTAPNQQQQQQPPSCLYDKGYFAKLDECLTRKPYPTIGLPAYKNDDLLVKRGLSERHGCIFLLSNGLFKNYQLSKFSVDSDSQCLDGGKVQLSMQMSNVSLYYLWTLRCLNYADQLLDDATLEGKTTLNNRLDEHNKNSAMCVGSSQNFGFTALQLSNIEAQVELATDIYKNWRLTNVTVAMLTPTTPPTSGSRSLDQQTNEQHTNDHHVNPFLSTGIKDFTFESLDSDELNWRYLHLFQNWSRNRMHSNFLEQYKRFLWLSLQRCLGESSEKLPVKLVDLFGQHKYT